MNKKSKILMRGFGHLENQQKRWKKMKKINREEYEILKGLDNQWKWISRDSNTSLWAYEKEPRKHEDFWGEFNGGFGIAAINLFQFIQWEDEEPYNIAWLLGEYEEAQHGYFNNELYERFCEESKEEEVKSKKDLIEKWELAIESAEFYGRGREDELIEYMREFVGDLKQLNETEQPKITLQDLTDKLWELPLNNRKLWLARLNDEFQEGYIVPLGLKTTDGEEQYLTYNGSYFASRRNRCLQQTFATLEEIPEFYRDLAERVL